MTTEQLVALGLWGVFFSAFLAGSIIPFASEAVLAGVLVLGASSSVGVAVATAGNVLGALTVYGLGRLAARSKRLDEGLLERWRVKEDPEKLATARQRVERWGSPILLLAWPPVLGDVLVLAAGLLRLSALPVVLFLTAGKGARYGVVAWTTMRLAGG